MTAFTGFAAGRAAKWRRREALILAGRLARLRGEPIESCPIKRLNADSNAWRHGWNLKGAKDAAR